MATINLVCAEHNFISFFEHRFLNILGALGKQNSIKVSKIDSLKRVYAKPKLKNIPSVSWFRAISKLFPKKPEIQHLKLVDNETALLDNEIILFVNHNNSLSMEALSSAIKSLEQNESQIIIDNVVHSLDCENCPQKAYWSFVHWVDTLQSSVVIGHESQTTSYIALTRSSLAKLVDFELDEELITYRKVV